MEKLDQFRKQMNALFLGKEETVDNVLCCFLADGHVLLEDVPGVGKTTLASSFAASLGLSFGRVQFTPDTMPGDVTGLTIYNMKSGEFEYRQGAIMKDIVLADELNRTPPKTQSALLEAMAERHVTVDGVQHALPENFMVIATQNPLSFAGTYPLPEAQLDRFMMRLKPGYPSAESEMEMLKLRMDEGRAAKAEKVLDDADIAGFKSKVKATHISDPMLEYMQNIVRSTRDNGDFMLGLSPRALIHLMQASRARAFIEGRDYVKPDDVRKIAVPVLAHRLVLTTEAKLKKSDAAQLLNALVVKTRIPVE